MRIDIDITDMADDPENISMDVDGPISHDEWRLVMGDISINARTDQVMLLREILNEHFGGEEEAD